MSCCDTTTTTTGGCCSIHGTVATGLGVRWDSKGATGPSTGVEIPVYQADAISPTVLTITSGQRLWIAWLQIVILTGGDARLYRGTAAGDHTQANAIIAGGPFGNNGGIVASPPWVRFSAGQRLWLKTDNDDPFSVVGYGILETITT